MEIPHAKILVSAGLRRSGAGFEPGFAGSIWHAKAIEGNAPHGMGLRAGLSQGLPGW
ncbi:MAG: hypothetical protein HXX15_22640 [Rhodopseudomonas sp.]|uniref:hypothetical protein n=1 Tax=Rhodopseudomonas sp. TaxID=1078 RepID=UPI0017C71B31|nr:hypothetical protein [Rhodopseudomonas sp.]NVN88884.1 hypothetical protein [Rhodopseudomonas sp.]